MEEMHPKAMEQMDKILGQLKSMGTDYAIEMACGGCQLSRDLLSKKFDKIDFLDHSTEACDIAEKTMEQHDIMGKVICKKMEDFKR